MKINNVEIENTYAEAFGVWAAGLIVTAIDERWVLNSVSSLTGFATSVIACGVEGGIDKFLKPEETPDYRYGARVLFFAPKLEELEHQLMNRIGQCVLTTPTASCYNDIKKTEKSKVITIGGKLKVFGDGFQISKRLPSPLKGKEARRFWRIPRMDGEMLCEDEFYVQRGIAGGNFLVIGKDVESVIKACEKAIEEIKKVPNVITPFPGGVVGSGSKVGSKKYPGILKASTNDAFCPTIKSITNTLLKPEENCVMEIVINALDIDSMNAAMRSGINAACSVDGVTRITAGNYGGKLGKFLIHLHELFRNQ